MESSRIPGVHKRPAQEISITKVHYGHREYPLQGVAQLMLAVTGARGNQNDTSAVRRLLCAIWVQLVHWASTLLSIHCCLPPAASAPATKSANPPLPPPLLPKLPIHCCLHCCQTTLLCHWCADPVSFVAACVWLPVFCCRNCWQSLIGYCGL